MKKTIKLSEYDLNRIVKLVLKESDHELEEDFFGDIKDKWSGLKGLTRGYGMDYFESMSKLRRLVKKLNQLDKPNFEVMNELEGLKQKVSAMNIPQERKDALTILIDNSLYHFKKYSEINNRILTTIENLKLDKWK
jgi:hypothetical protein